VVGYLFSGSEMAAIDAAFRKGLSEMNFVEGRNITIDYLRADDHYARLPALAAELARRNVAVILAAGGADVALSRSRHKSCRKGGKHERP
jgi:putative ABC transport system substrate-binding protein